MTNKYYEYRHIVGFEETNVVGNVYFASFVSWQGRCREMFLREHAPEVLVSMSNNFALITTHVSCDYLLELQVFDEVILQMSLSEVVQNRITMLFDYRKPDGSLCAKGRQQIACMRRSGHELIPMEIPHYLQKALQQYR